MTTGTAKDILASIPVIGDLVDDDVVPTPMDDVERSEAAKAINQAALPDVPVARVPDPGDTTLLHGLVVDGIRHKNARVRELRGSDEEALARLDVERSDYQVLLIDMIIKRSTVSIGDIDVQKDPSVLSKLLMGDRDLLFVKTMLTTYGDQKTYEDVVCPACQFSNDIEVDIPDIIEYKGAASDSEVVVVPLRKGRGTAEVRYPTGADQMFVFDGHTRSTSTADLNTRIISRVLTTYRGQPFEGDRIALARDMNADDRKRIVAALAEAPSVTFKEVSVPCSSCEKPLPFVFGWADLLSL